MTLSNRALNRALLARQHLLERASVPPSRLVERLVGLQAQSPQNPYVALWSRLGDFDAPAFSRLIASRKMVRLALMRSTIHLVSARDCLALRPVVQPAIDRSLRGTFGKRLAGLDLDALAAAGRTVLAEEPRLLGAIGTELALRSPWRGRDPFALSHAVRALIPLVQPPPRGLWRTGGQAVHTSAEQWLGRPLDYESAPDAIVLRYLAAFGPATVSDAQVWSGLSGLASTFEHLRPSLRTFMDERGRQLFDVARGPLPDPDTPAPPRFLPEYDNVLLSHHDRSRIVPPAVRAGAVTPPTSTSWLLLDGFLAGTWSLKSDRKAATLAVLVFGSLTREQRRDVVEEGERLLAFLEPEKKGAIRIDRRG